MKLPDLFLKVTDGVLVRIGEKVEDLVLDVILFQVVHQVGPVALERQSDAGSEVSKRSPAEKRKPPTLTCSLDVTAQKTISVNP